jgi:hypothetical protein
MLKASKSVGSNYEIWSITPLENSAICPTVDLMIPCSSDNKSYSYRFVRFIESSRGKFPTACSEEIRLQSAMYQDTIKADAVTPYRRSRYLS